MNPPASSHTSNAELIARSRKAIWHPCTQMKTLEHLPPVPVARAEGVWLYDFEDRRYLDAISSWWVNLFGHTNPRINAALRDQLDTLEHTMLAGFTHRPAIELSERLAALSGLGHAFYGSDGASATEIALKMSFHFWRNSGQTKKTRFVALAGGYHGETLGALSVTDIAVFRNIYAPLLRNNLLVTPPDGEDIEPAAQALESLLAELHGEIAALIVEPLVQCAGGMKMYPAEYLKRARAVCDRYGVHLIADEIAVGFGRTGTFFACEQAGIKPDFLCLSKGLTGGYLPLSAVLTTNTVFNAFYADDVAHGFLHSHSYTGNALACRAALATLDIFEQDAVIAANRSKAEKMNMLCAPLAAHPRVSNFRNLGMIWAFEVADAAPDFSQRFFAAALKQELLLRPIGNTVYFMPPYVISDADMALLATRTLEIIGKMN